MKNCPMYSLRSSVLPSLRSGPGAVFSKWPLRIDSSKSDYDFAALGLGANDFCESEVSLWFWCWKKQVIREGKGRFFFVSLALRSLTSWFYCLGVLNIGGGFLSFKTSLTSFYKIFSGLHQNPLYLPTICAVSRLFWKMVHNYNFWRIGLNSASVRFTWIGRGRYRVHYQVFLFFERLLSAFSQATALDHAQVLLARSLPVLWCGFAIFDKNHWFYWDF